MFKPICKMINSVNPTDKTYNKACLSCDCKLCLVGSHKKIVIFKTDTGEIDNLIEEGHTSSVMGIAWQPRAAHFSSADANGCVAIW